MAAKRPHGRDLYRRVDLAIAATRSAIADCEAARAQSQRFRDYLLSIDGARLRHRATTARSTANVVRRGRRAAG